MNNFLKVITTIFFSICFCYKTYAFDLKSLTDKIQKDIGNKLQVPKGGNSSGNSNPLGGMLKNLNKNKGGGSSLNLGNMSQASSSGTGNKKLAKEMCEPNIAKILKGLPKGNISSLSSDFNNKSNDEISNILKTSPKSPDKFVQTIDTFDGAFETREVEEVFSAFLNTKSLDDLATLKALSGIKPGFQANKKQIKADASFAYGLVHYFYHANGGNKQLGINLIKQSANVPNNIGALSLYGAWQFNGINVKQNIESGNSNALEGYNRASQKNRDANASGPRYQMKKIKFPEKIFLELAADNRNPYKQQYQNQLAQATQMNKNVMKSLKNSEKYDKKSGWWPAVVAQQNRQNNILTKLGNNIGLAKKLKPLKAAYEVLKTKIAKDPTDSQTVEEMVIINQQLIDEVGKAFDSAEAVDAKGKKQIKVMAVDNELLLLKGRSLTFTIMGQILAQGGFDNMFETVKMVEILGQNRSISCKAYSGIKSYAKRTEIQLPKPLTNEDEENPFSSDDG